MLAASLSVQGSELAREGRTPLMAVCSMVGGHVVHAAVFDPEDSSADQALDGKLVHGATMEVREHVGQGG